LKEEINIIDIPIYINSKLIQLNSNIIELNDVIYINIIDVCNILNISKSIDIKYDNITKYVSIIKNNNELLINNSLILFNNNTYNTGYVFYRGILYIPIKIIIELYNGEYIEKNNSIYINTIV